MIKTFENCSPEYQITIVCFFIFLTLLCMILVIYEGTGKRGRKMLLSDSVLLIVIFLITAVLCVWQRAFYEEDSMILFKIPYVILIVIGIGVFLYVGLKIFGIYKYRKSCLRENAVQESLDNLPSGIVFFDGNGMPKLMNRRMHQICMNLAGFPSTDNAALTWVTHAYDYGMVRFEMGYACAITVVLFLVMIAVNNVIQRLINRHAES